MTVSLVASLKIKRVACCTFLDFEGLVIAIGIPDRLFESRKKPDLQGVLFDGNFEICGVCQIELVSVILVQEKEEEDEPECE